jgi:hypothetical protein
MILVAVAIAALIAGYLWAALDNRKVRGRCLELELEAWDRATKDRTR